MKFIKATSFDYTIRCEDGEKIQPRIVYNVKDKTFVVILPDRQDASLSPMLTVENFTPVLGDLFKVEVVK